MTRSRARDAAFAALLGVVLAFVVVAPLTRRGWLVLLDWAPGPRGIGPTGGAALPTGPLFVVPAQVAHSLFGAAVGWLPLAAALAVAAAGGAELVGGPWPARVVAGVAYAWNPFVFDRIATGQVAFLAGYAVLPWLARSALRAESWRGALAVGIWWSAAALCTLHFAWIGGIVVLAVAIVRGREQPLARVGAGVAIGVALVAVLAGGWVLATGHHAPPRGSPSVLTTFGTTSDPDLGRSLGILAQQGFWRPVVKRPRDDLGTAFPFVACAVIAAAAGGLVLARRTRDDARARLAGAGAISAVVGWVLAHGAAGPLGAAYRAAFEHVPGFAVMREAQKWAALVALATAIGLGCLAAAIAQTRVRVLAWLLVGVPLAFAPTLAWGLASRIEPSRYPASWAAVRAEIDSRPGEYAALPWEHYVLPGITGNRTVANLGPAYFGARVVASDAPNVVGLSGDTGRRARVADAVRAARADAIAGRRLGLGRALAQLGFRGIVVVGVDPGLPLERDPELRRATVAPDVGLWLIASP